MDGGAAILMHPFDRRFHNPTQAPYRDFFRAIRFLNAGGDMIVVGPTNVAITMAKALATQAAAYPSFRTRVNSAALNVLRAKQAKGLLSCA